MPGATIGVERERRWPSPARDARPTPILGRCRPVDRRAQQGCGRRTTRAPRSEQAVTPGRDPMASIGSPSSAADRHKERRFACRVGGRQQQPTARSPAAAVCTRRRKLASIRPWSGSPHAEEPKPPASSAERQRARKLEQRERIAAGTRREFAPARARPAGADDRREQLPRMRVRKSLESQSRADRVSSSNSNGSRISEREYDRLGLQAPGHERRSPARTTDPAIGRRLRGNSVG